MFKISLSILLINFFLIFMSNSSFACDVHTYSNYDYIRVSYMSMTLDIDMDDMKFKGYVDLSLERLNPSKKLVLDTMDLEIREVWMTSNSEAKEFRKAFYELTEAQDERGQKLTISIEEDIVLVRIGYSATKNSSEKLFSGASLASDPRREKGQSKFEATRMRTFVPSQDTKANKVIFSADIKVLSENTDLVLTLGMPELTKTMIADRHYKFSTPKEISTEFITLSAGVATK